MADNIKKIDIKIEDGIKKETPLNSGDDSNEIFVDKDTIINELKAKVEKAEDDAKINYDRFLRVSAEFENYKKRTARETDEFRKYANESLINQILPVIDNLERAVQASKEKEKNNGPLINGVVLTLNEIHKVLEKFNIKPFSSIGEAFDPNFHQAMMQADSDEHPDNTVLQELQRGYMIHNRLLRPAMVVVSKQKEKSTGLKDNKK
jgi:molecular chaperone GrpE